MFIHVRRLLTPPLIEDERTALRAKILHYVLILVTPLLLINSVLSIGGPRFYLNLIGLSMCVLSYYFVHHDAVQRASILFLGLAWVITTASLFLTGGVNSNNYILYGTLILWAAALLSERWTIVVATMNIVVVLFITFADTYTDIDFPDSQTTSVLVMNRVGAFVGLTVTVIFILRAFNHIVTRLENAQRQYRTLFESATVPMITISPDMRVQLINLAAAKILNRPVEDLIGQPIEQLVPAKNAPYFVQRVRRVLSTGHGESFEDVLTLHQQKYRFLATFQPIFDESGKPAAVQLISQDITVHKLAEERERELVLAQAKDQLTRELLSNISHDLKTPLAIIHTDLYNLNLVKDPQQHQTMVERIQQQTKLLDRFIQDILMLAGLENMEALKRRDTNINEMLTGVIQQLLPIAEQKQIRLHPQLSSEVPPIFADSEQLQHAFVNLIENAVTYTPNGGEVMVRTSVPAPAHLVVEIVDTGIGIDEADLPYIFERFYRAEKVRTREKAGSGLGLAIVKRVLDMHQYPIEVQSAAGKGTTFRVLIARSLGEPTALNQHV